MCILEDRQHRILACQGSDLRGERLKRSLPPLWWRQFQRGVASVVRQRQHFAKKAAVMSGRRRALREQRIELIEFRLRGVVVR